MPITAMGAEVPIARRNLLADKAKFFVALGGVALAVVLILVVGSLYQGVRRESASFIRSLPGEVWVAQKGIAGLTFSNSFLTKQAAADVAGIPGVQAVHRLDGRLAGFDVHGHETRIYVWAMAPGGKLTAEEERFLPEPGTIFIDRSLAKEAGLSRGDSVRYGDAEFTVAEVGHVGNVLIAQFAFVNHDDYDRLFGVPGAANFFLVSVSPEATEGVMDEIARRVGGSSVFTTEEFVKTAEEERRSFLPIMRVVTAISFIVGLALLSLTIYSATIERAREYGIMKALGASHWRLYRIVLSQSAIIAVLGFSVGVGLAFLFNRVVGDVVPEFVTYIRWQDVALALGVAALMTFVASYLPINRVARVDPASVFRA
jgi:putative ABC transport system permease protein